MLRVIYNWIYIYITEYITECIYIYITEYHSDSWKDARYMALQLVRCKVFPYPWRGFFIHGMKLFRYSFCIDYIFCWFIIRIAANICFQMYAFSITILIILRYSLSMLTLSMPPANYRATAVVGSLHAWRMQRKGEPVAFFYIF